MAAITNTRVRTRASVLLIIWDTKALLQTHIKYRPKIKLLQAFLIIFIMSGCAPAIDDSEFYLINGEKKQLSDFEGSWLLINFWAEWCRPCIEEVPELNELHAASAELNLAVLAFSYEPESNDKLRQAVARYSMNYPVVATDPQPKVPFNRPNKLPAMYIFSPDGTQHGPIFGKQSKETIVQLIETLDKG